MRNPRRPTRQELEQLADIQYTCFGYLKEEAVDLVRYYACVAVFDDYITTTPFYAGKLMLVVWAAFPSMYEAYTWDEHGQLCYVPKDSELAKQRDEEETQHESVTQY